MEAKLYNQLFNKLDSLSAVRKDLTLWCEITTCECNDWCCWIEEWVIWEKYWICEWWKTSYIWTSFSVNIIEVKWHPPIYTDVIDWVNEATKEWMYLRDTAEKVLYEIISKWNLSKPLLSEQSDELGEYLLTLLR